MKLGALVGGSATVIGPEATVADAAEILVSSGLGSLGVIDERQLVGIFTERDVVRCVSAGSDPEEVLVADWMSDAPDTFSPDVDCEEAAAWLLEVGYRHMPVMGDGELLGIVSIRDILWAIISGD
ncbi:MAG: CBS domain-containing protein [Actinobacteria bacterium]|nr:CBS domain-containing protein [Actinomycetota bacterium]MBU1493325.1 CBS domain-containing protein [Actinomycetota bacterium]